MMWSKSAVVVLVIALSGAVFCIDCSRKKETENAEYKLRYWLFCENPYDAHARPVDKREDVVQVKINLGFKYVEVDEYNNHIWVHGHLGMQWPDAGLKWEPDDHGGLRQINIWGHEVWLPDITIYNSESSDIMLDPTVLCVLNYNGTVTFTPTMSLPAQCDLNLRDWPFDSQNCSITVGSWSNPGSLIDVVLGPRLRTMNFNNWWRLDGFSQERVAQQYGRNLSFPNIKFRFNLTRQSSLYSTFIIGPAFVFAGLTLASFLASGLPIRCIVCCTSALANAILLQYVGYHLPAEGTGTPKIIIYYRDSLLLTILAMMISVLVNQIKAAAEEVSGDAPEWLVKSTAYLRGRGGKAGQLLLGSDFDAEQFVDENSDVESSNDFQKEEKKKDGVSYCNVMAIFIDRLSFLVFSILYLTMLIALVP